MAADRKAIVEQINEGFARNDLEQVLSFCSDNLSWNMIGEKTVTGKDAIRTWIASMGPQPPQFTIEHTVAEGDFVITRGDGTMKEKKDGSSEPYAFCDIYHFTGDKVDELVTFVIKTDKQTAGV
jgi:uncharacterized protein